MEAGTRTTLHLYYAGTKQMSSKKKEDGISARPILAAHTNFVGNIFIFQGGPTTRK